MGLAAVVAFCLCGQIRYSVEDSLNQWEQHLLETKWAVVDKLTGVPKMLLVIKCYTPDHRLFELYQYDRWDNEPEPTLRAWTGRYKMESRENRDKSMSEKIVRLNVDEHWLPVDGLKLAKTRNWMLSQGFVHWINEDHRFHWTEELDFLHWTEEQDFKPFLAEFKIEPGDAPENVKFLLRSDDIKRVGWWVIGTGYQLEPVKKWRRSTTAAP